MSDLGYADGNLALLGAASEVKRAKHELWQLIAKHLPESEFTQRELAKKIENGEARVEILRGKISSFAIYG